MILSPAQEKVFKSLYEIEQQKVFRSVESLRKKNLLPNHTKDYFNLEPKNIKFLTDITIGQEFKEWTCPICQISVYGPKQLYIQHHKIHSQRRELKENEIYKSEYNLYR